eukprot:CAMPEP_0205886156 /NCGR_PEP_ID=MMETSP1083-20121108/19091_1 /ASSEMBLY_ACC=CAM_ASM_000430 /TAXON_ID=97485 /ORGANISM="Prymnesium parvum, Strain Texoma1" /LENGTH=98 /DNA_ID=CAMNT_0053249785 /DNA_START=312 /DNA_END=608 /DNA_ORIENTATION=+
MVVSLAVEERCGRHLALRLPREQITVQRPHELHTSLLLQEIDDVRHNEVEAKHDAKALPAQADLGVLGRREAIQLIHQLHHLERQFLHESLVLAQTSE